MSFHRNAKLGLAGRYALVCAIEGGMSLKAAAAAFSQELRDYRIYDVALRVTQVQADMSMPIATSPPAWLLPTCGIPILAEYVPHGSLDRPASCSRAWACTRLPGSATHCSHLRGAPSSAP